MLVVIGCLFWDRQEKSTFLIKMEEVKEAKAKGDLSEQVRLLKQVLKERQGTLGDNHLAVARLSSRLVHAITQTYSVKDHFQDIEKNHTYAMRVSDQAIQIFKNHLGVEHWETGKAICQKGYLISEYRLNKDQSPTQRAIMYMQEGLIIVEDDLGREDLQTKLLKSLLASMYLYQGRYEEAERYYEETTDWVANNVGLNSERLAWHLTALSKAKSAQGKFWDAYRHAEKAEKIYRESLGETSREYADLIYRKGVLAVLMDKWKAAKILLKKSSSLFMESHGKEALSFRWAGYDLGFVLSAIEIPPSLKKARKILDYMEVLDLRYTTVLEQPIKHRKLSLEEILMLREKAHSELKKVEFALER